MSGPWYVEPDDSFKGWHGNTYRVVTEEARRQRNKQGTSARPNYVATVYGSLDLARLIAAAPTLAQEKAELMEALQTLADSIDEPDTGCAYPNCNACIRRRALAAAYALLTRLTTGSQGPPRTPPGGQGGGG